MAQRRKPVVIDVASPAASCRKLTQPRLDERYNHKYSILARRYLTVGDASLGCHVCGFVVGGFGLCRLKKQSRRMPAKMLFALLVAQVTLGLSNVCFSLPLAAARAHDGVAAILFSMMPLIIWQLRDYRN